MTTIFPITEVVNTTINYGDQSVSTKNYDVPLIITSHNVTSNVVDTYSTVDALVADGWAAGSAVHTMVSGILGGANPPPYVLIGKRTLTDYRVTPDVANTTAYTVYVKVNNTYSKTFTFTSDADATAAEIAIGLAALIEADSDIGSLVAASNASGVLVIAPTSTNKVSVGVGTTNLTVSNTSAASIADTMTAITNVNSAFFYVTTDSKVEADIDAIAAWVEANERYAILDVQDSDIWTSATDDLVSDLKNLEYNNTMIVALDDANKSFGAANVIGFMAGNRVGRGTYATATIKGLVPTSKTLSQVNYALGKNANVYKNRGATNDFSTGISVSGRDAEQQRAILYITTGSEEAVYGEMKRMVDSGYRFSFTDSSIRSAANALQKFLSQEQQAGTISEYTITPPLADDVSDADKLAGTLRLNFTATVPGTVKTILINGYINL